jgi:SAM-dependent methyltransferase
MIDEQPRIVPERGGFPPDAFDRLQQVEPGHYWFESRNRLIAWALGRYFPGATSLLEVGCGTGFVLLALRAAFPTLQLTASDAAEAGLAIARMRVPDATFVRQDARALDAAGQYDVVCAFDVLEHITEDVNVLRRLFAATKPGGGALITVPQHPRLWSRADECGRHVRRYGRRELVDKMRHAGFVPRRVTSFVSLLLPVLAVSRWLERGRQGALGTREVDVPATVNAMLTAVLAVERQTIRLGVSWPAGGSLLAVAYRPLV